jgi:hypothetical protein
VHGFTAFPSQLAAHASAAQIAFLERAIETSGTATTSKVYEPPKG